MTTTCSHTWHRTEEHKAYPHNRKLAYARLVSTCTTCGLVNRGGWRRILKSSVRS